MTPKSKLSFTPPLFNIMDIGMSEFQIQHPDRLQAAALHTLHVCRLWLGALCLALLGACGGGSSDPVDTTVPTLSIASDAPATARAAFKLTFSFSAPVTIPNSDGILAWSTDNGNANADRSTFKKLSATQYTVVVTPNAAKKGDWTLTVPAGAYKNAGGNASNAAAATVTQYIDTMPPVGTFNATLPTGQIFFSGPTVVTLSFDTALDADLTLDKLVASSVAIATATANAPGSIGNLLKTSAPGAAPVYTFVYTPIGGNNAVTVTLPAGAVAAGGIPNAGSAWGPVVFNLP